MTALEMVSMSADSRSATRSMPTGAAQPPTSTTSGPPSASTRSVTLATSTRLSAVTETSRWTFGRR